MRGDGARCDWLIRTERFCACVVAAPARCLGETEEEEREKEEEWMIVNTGFYIISCGDHDARSCLPPTKSKEGENTFISAVTVHTLFHEES